jgi:hypothetical protein
LLIKQQHPLSVYSRHVGTQQHPLDSCLLFTRIPCSIFCCVQYFSRYPGDRGRTPGDGSAKKIVRISRRGFLPASRASSLQLLRDATRLGASHTQELRGYWTKAKRARRPRERSTSSFRRTGAGRVARGRGVRRSRVSANGMHALPRARPLCLVAITQ